VALQRPDHPLLRNRLRVDAYVVTAQKSDALIADTGPAFNGKGRQDVFLVQGNGARKVPVELGFGDCRAVEVLSGAKAQRPVFIAVATQDALSYGFELLGKLRGAGLARMPCALCDTDDAGGTGIDRSHWRDGAGWRNPTPRWRMGCEAVSA